MLAEWFRRLWYLLNRRRLERDLHREMATHREMMGDDSAGFGNTLRLHEEARDVWGWTYVDDLVQDLRYGFRNLARTPAFTVTALLTIAIGIGATTAVFSVVDRVLDLRQRPAVGTFVSVSDFLRRESQPSTSPKSGSFGPLSVNLSVDSVLAQRLLMPVEWAL